jgi:hypothetical protein
MVLVMFFVVLLVRGGNAGWFMMVDLNLDMDPSFNGSVCHIIKITQSACHLIIFFRSDDIRVRNQRIYITGFEFNIFFGTW